VCKKLNDTFKIFALISIMFEIINYMLFMMEEVEDLEEVEECTRQKVYTVCRFLSLYCNRDVKVF
jgi:hypothetical protein